MKSMRLFLILSFFISTITLSINAMVPTETKKLNREKKSLIDTVKEFVTCVKGGKDCDPQKTKIYRIGLGIIGLLVAGTLGRIYWVQTLPSRILKKQKAIGNALITAAKNSDLPEVNRLLQLEGVNVEVTTDDDYVMTPLAIAARNGTKAIVEALVDAGADINAISDSGQTPLFYAVQRGHDAIAQFLIDKGANINLGRARNKQTALHVAVSPFIVDYLINHGAKIDAKDTLGNTPLMQAAYWGSIENVKRLLTAGAKIGDKNSRQNTALEEAKLGKESTLIRDVRAKYDPIIELLQETLLQENRKVVLNQDLRNASGRGDLTQVKSLLNEGAQVNDQDRSGGTALHQAASQNHLKIVKELLNAGADPNIKDKDGLFPRDEAKNPEIFNLLKSASQ